MAYKHDIDDARESWNEIFKDIRDVEGFSIFISSLNEGDFWNFTAKLKKAKPYKYGYDSGACRGVIWTNNNEDFGGGYVFKIPFRNYERFDYCANEVDVYREAMARGVEECFAWSASLGDWEWDGIRFPVYAMEYCNCNEDELVSMIDTNLVEMQKQELEDRGEDPNDPYHSFWGLWDCDDAEDEILNFMAKHWGDKIYDNLLSLLGDYCIGDLHTGNWGFEFGNDQILKIVDYAGYGDSAQDSYYNRTGKKRPQKEMVEEEFTTYSQGEYVPKDISEIATQVGQLACNALEAVISTIKSESKTYKVINFDNLIKNSTPTWRREMIEAASNVRC